MVFGYIRVSTNKQDVESQKIGIVKKSEELGLPIDEWIADEGVSGIKEYNKRNLGVLMEKIKSGDTLIVSEISRLARSVFMLFRIVEHCIQTNNCTIYAVKENQVFKKSDVISAITLSIFGAAAQIEREMIIKRTTEGLERRKREGVIFGKPVGFKKVTLKLAASHKKLLEYIKRGVSKQKIASLLKCSKTTLSYYLYRNKINYEGQRKNKTYYNYHNIECHKISKKRQKCLNKNKAYILKLIKNERIVSPKKILEKLKDRKLDISPSSLRLWFYKNPNLHSLLVKENTKERRIRNIKLAPAGLGY